MTHKSQSALEYIMTYGWAILIIVIVAVILYSMGIFNPASSLVATVTGFPGFTGVTAVCTPTGVLVMSVGNAVGYPVFIRDINSTYNSHVYSTNVSSFVLPDQSSKVFVLHGCSNVSGARYSSSIVIQYTEPTQPLQGPYISTGTVGGTASSFSQNTVAYYDNNSYVTIPHSASFNTIWNSGRTYTLIMWMKVTRIYGGNKYLIQEVPGCTSGTASSAYNSTWFSVFEIEWVGGADTCTNTGGQSVNHYAPYNRWVMVTGILSNKSTSGHSWIAICVDQSCSNNTYTAGIPANYSDPNPYYTYVGMQDILGDVSNVQVYNFAFSGKQIQTEYALGYAGIPISANGLVAWLPMDGNANDYSGNNNNGVPTNVNWVSP